MSETLDTSWRHVTDLSGKTVVVTGCASGIGRATALQFASAGAIVYGGDRNEADGEATLASIRQGGGQAFGGTIVAVVGARQHQRRNANPCHVLDRRINECGKDMDQRQWIPAYRLKEGLRHPFERSPLECTELGEDVPEEG